MDARRSRTTVTCTSCGSVWEGRNARFCGHCGARLAGDGASGATSAEGRPGDEPQEERRGRRLTLRGAVVLLLVGGPLVWYAASDEVVEPAPRATDRTVELPDPDDLGAAEAVPDAPPTGQPPPDVPMRCAPAGCERWRIDLAQGASETVGDVLIHASVGRRNSDQTPGGAGASTEVEVSAVDVRSGAPRWQAPVPGTRSQVLAAAPATVHVIGDDVVAVVVPSGVHAFDVADGQRRWSADVGVHVTDLRPTDQGDLVAWGRPQPRAVRVYGPSGVTEPVGPNATLLGIDREGGDVLWRQDDLVPLVWEPTTVLADRADGRGLLGVDTTTGELRWERGDLPEPRRVVRGDRVFAVHTDRAIEVVDLASGATRHELEIGVGAREVLTFVGSRLAVLGFGHDGEGQDEDGQVGARTVRLIDPGTPGAPTREFVGITGVASVQAEAEHGAPTPRGLPLLAIADQTDAWFRVRVIDGEGTVVWENHRPLTYDTCCYEVAVTGDRTGVVVLPPVPRIEPVQVLAVDDGRPLRTIRASGATDVDVVRWADELLQVERARPGGHVTTLHGSAARLEVDGPARLVAVDPLPIVQTATTVVGLEPELFLGRDGTS